MPRVNRSEIVATDEVQAFHLVNRCVRKSFLCGKDLQTGRDFSHRKNWIRDRLEQLAGIFAIEILSYSVMDNHVHVVVKTRPDLVRSWSDRQTALRWWNLFPQRRHQDGTPAVPTEQELRAIQIDRSRLIQLRKRLSCVSWFMRCLAEPIARRANREEETTGRFWDGRFFAQPLLDEAAIAACIAYVELNALRLEWPTHSRKVSSTVRVIESTIARRPRQFADLNRNGKQLSALDQGGCHRLNCDTT